MAIQNLPDFKTAIASLSTRAQGSAFEIVVKSYLTHNPEYKDVLENVWLLEEVPTKVRKHLNLPRKDKGIDLVAQTKDGQYWAIQVKYRSKANSSLNWRELSTFHTLAFGICHNVSFALVCSTTKNATKEADGLSKTQFLLGDVWNNLEPQYFADVSQWLESQKQERISQAGSADIGVDCYWCETPLYSEDYQNIWFCGWPDYPQSEFYMAHIECIPQDCPLLSPISALCTNEGFTRLKNTLLKGEFTFQRCSDWSWEEDCKLEKVITESIMMISRQLGMQPKYYDNGLLQPSLETWSRSKADTEAGVKEIVHSVCGVEEVYVSVLMSNQRKTLAEFEAKYGGAGQFEKQIKSQIEHCQQDMGKAQADLDNHKNLIGSQPTQHQQSWTVLLEQVARLHQNALIRATEAQQAYSRGEYELVDQLLREANRDTQRAWKLLD